MVQVVSSLEEIQEQRPTALAIGTFDGVHLGHQLLLQKMIGQVEGLRTAVLTFHPHPKKVVRNVTGRLYLATLEQRIQLIAEQGIDLVITLPFDETMRHTRAADFVDQLKRYVGIQQLWSGDFGLGYKREGNAAYLTELGQAGKFTVHEVHELLQISGEAVSSTRIREQLQAGDVAALRPLLDRPYQLSGIVIQGDQRGRTINFPTANLDVWDEIMIPANGVYATWATVGEERYAAATNIGVRPTVDGVNLRIEAHLLDFDEDIYGEVVTLDFLERVRSEKKFSGLEELKAQIAADVEQVREICAAEDV